MKCFTIAILLLFIVALVGCSYSPVKVTPIAAEDPEEPVAIKSYGAITAIPATYELSSKGAVGFEPGKYTISNFGVGKEADLPITLHSDRTEPIVFQLSYRTPSYTKEGYALAPEVVGDWLFFETSSPILQAQERREFMATLCLPDNATVPDKWEFWIAIKEVGQTSQVQVEGCLRVFVNMRQ